VLFVALFKSVSSLNFYSFFLNVMWAIGQVLPTPFNRPANRPANSSLRLFLVNNPGCELEDDIKLKCEELIILPKWNSSFYQSKVRSKYSSK